MLEALAEAVRDLARVDPESIPEGELSATLVELHELKMRLEAVESALTARWDGARCWVDDGARTASAWLGGRCRMAAATAKRRVRVARALRSMPATEAAWAAGEIGSDHVWELVLSNGPRTSEVFERDEKVLVDQARDRALKFVEFAIAQRYWRQLADEDGAERDAVEQHGRRRMHVSQSLSGWCYGEFGLDAVNGAILTGTLDAITDELFQADWADAKARLGRRVTVADLARTHEQRRADALVEMAVRARTAPADGRRPAPLFTALMGYETFAGRICELAGGIVVPPGALAGYLADAYIERVVFDGPSRIIDVGAQRLFTGALRRAIQVRDRFCFHELCDVPSDRCEIDHEIPYADGGPTTEWNGRPGCGCHNRGRQRRRTEPSPDEDGDPDE